MIIEYLACEHGGNYPGMGECKNCRVVLCRNNFNYDWQRHYDKYPEKLDKEGDND